MKEKATYRRFNLIAFLAILGCIGMLLFECIFIFELYDRAASQLGSALPVQAVRREIAEPAPAMSLSNSPAVSSPVSPAPAATNTVTAPADVPPAQIEKAPAAAVPVG